MFTFSVPTTALFGAGKLDELHTQINTPMGAVHGQKALVVISSGKSARAGGYLDRLENELRQAGAAYVVFDKVSANPTKPVVEEGGRFAQENGCDFIVALGGGSVIDAAKAIGLMAANGGDLWDYVMFGSGKKQWPQKPGLPIVAIPTTAGTGSETDGGAVITNPETNEKTGVFGPGTTPVLAVVDPELMKSVPAKFKAYQGFDALFHSTEGYISASRNEFSKMVAAEAIRNVARNLALSIREPENMEAMSAVALGSYLSGIQMAVGSCTSAHPLEHALSAYHEKLPHGAGLIMISKAYYSHFVEQHACDDRFIEMAKLMGMEDADKPEDFITALVKLQEDCGVADLKMSDYGIDPSEFPKMVQNARDMYGNGCVVAHRVHAPDTFVQRFPAEYDLGILHQKQQQLIFPVFQLYVPAVHGDAAGVRVDGQPTKCHFMPGAQRFGQPLILCQMCLDARDKHAGRKRLFDVVVRTQPQAADLVNVLAPGGYHQDGDIERLAQAAAHGKTVKPGQHQVEQDQVELPVQPTREAAFPVRRNLDRKPVNFQIVALNGGDGFIVFNNQDALHGLPSFGNVMMMDSPPPGAFSARIVPPICETALAAMASPSPLPPDGFLRAGSLR